MKAHVNVFLAIVIVAAGMFGGAAAPQAAAQQQGQYGCTVAATADGGFVLQCGLGVEGATYVCAPTGDGNAFAVASMVAPATTATCFSTHSGAHGNARHGHGGHAVARARRTRYAPRPRTR